MIHVAEWGTVLVYTAKLKGNIATKIKGFYGSIMLLL